MGAIARPMWKGVIQFGLVTCPVRVHLGQDSPASGAHLLHASCRSRVHQRTWCAACDVEVSRTDMLRGFEVARDRWVALDDDDLSGLRVKTQHTIEVAHFVPLGDAADLETHSRQPYYLAPEPLGRRTFALLAAALAETGLAGVAKITIRDREHLATVRPRGDGLVLTTLAWPEEIRPIESLDLPARDGVPETELRLAADLLRAMVRPFAPAEHRDEYAAALRSLVEAKAEGSAFALPDAAPSDALVDLMAALEASVAAAVAARQPAPKPLRARRRTSTAPHSAAVTVA